MFADSGGRGIEGATFTTGEETKGESTAHELTSEEEMRWRPHSALTGDFGWGRKDLQEKKKKQQQREEREAYSRKLSTSSSIPSQKPSPSKRYGNIAALLVITFLIKYHSIQWSGSYQEERE